MKRSITRVGLTLGAVALLAVSAACSKQKEPKEPSPTFESSMSAPAPEPTAPMPTGTMAAPPPAATTPPAMPPMDQGQAPSGQSGQPGPGAQAMPPSERESCERLKRDANITVEDVQGGVTLVLKPKPGTDLTMVRDEAHGIEQQIGAGSRPSLSEQCMLFDSTHHLGVSVSITEATGSVRMMITTTDPAQVKTLRRQMRDFAAMGWKPKSGAHQ